MAKSINELNADLFSPAEDDRINSPLEARRKAMDFLARREHGRMELVRKLEARGFRKDIAEDAVARLVEEGLQSDRRFVENFIQSRINQGKGPRRIAQELSQRVQLEGVLDEVLDSFDEDWPDLARRVRLKKFGAQVPDDYKERARQMRFLQYRGFDSRQIGFALGGGKD